MKSNTKTERVIGIQWMSFSSPDLASIWFAVGVDLYLYLYAKH